MTSELVTFRDWHLEHLPVAGERHVISGQAEAGPAFTLIKDGTIVGCGGVARIASGAGDCWMIPGCLDSNPLISVKTVRRILQFTQPLFSRLQMNVREDDPKAVRFAEFLGFEREGLMRKFDGKHNYFLFARING